MSFGFRIVTFALLCVLRMVHATSVPLDARGSDDVSTYLHHHNTLRSRHGAHNLAWSRDLAGHAQVWADRCVFSHSHGALGPFGENLAAGAGHEYFTIGNAIKLWADEVGDYDGRNPVPSHFTQMVWKGSNEVGCAVAECDGLFDPSFGPAQFYVCEYAPAGNVLGQFAENVGA